MSTSTALPQTPGPTTSIFPLLSLHHSFFDLDRHACTCRVLIFRREIDGAPRIAVVMTEAGRRPVSDPVTSGLMNCAHQVATSIHKRHFPNVSPFYVRWFVSTDAGFLYEAEMEHERKRGGNVYLDPVWSEFGGHTELNKFCGGLAVME